MDPEIEKLIAKAKILNQKTTDWIQGNPKLAMLISLLIVLLAWFKFKVETSN